VIVAYFGATVFEIIRLRLQGGG